MSRGKTDQMTQIGRSERQSVTPAMFVWNWKSPVILSSFLLIIIATVFWPACDNGFLHWDDNCYVFREPEVLNGIRWRGLQWAATADVAGHWHPLTLISLQLDAQLFGTGPVGFHRTAVFLHAMNAVLAFLAIWSLTGSHWRSLVVAALFALHPLRVESVAWVSERKDLLSGLFFWLTILAYVRYTKRPSTSQYIAMAFCFACGLASKSVLVTTPCILLLLDCWPLARLTSPFETTSARVWRLIVEKIPLFALSIVVSGLTIVYQQRALADYAKLPFEGRIRNAAVSFVSYVSQTIWPVGLSAFYTIHEIPNVKFYGALVFLCTITSLVIWQSFRRPYLLIGWLWFLVMLLPVSGLMQCGRQARADRYTYLAHVGLFLAIVWGVADLVQRSRRASAVSIALLTAFLVGFAVVTHQQILVWHDSESIWRQAFRLDPDCHVIVQENLIKSLFWEGQKAEATDLTNQFILATDESNTDKLVTFAMLLAAQGEHEACIRTLDSALKHFHPKRAELYSNRGKAKAALGKWHEAANDFRQASKLNPQSAPFQFYLAHALKKAGDDAESRQIYANALQRFPGWPQEALRSAWQMSTSPYSEERVDFWPVCLAQQAIEAVGETRPLFLDVLAAAYAQSGRFDEAISTTTKAVEMAESQRQFAMANEMRTRLKLYQNHEPYRQTPPFPQAAL